MWIGGPTQKMGKDVIQPPNKYGVDYFINNLKDGKGSLMGKNAGGFLKRKLKSEVGGK